MARLIDLAGETFGRLTVLGPIERRGAKVVWRCRCECGEECLVMGGSLREGRTRSCGCLRREVTGERGKHSKGAPKGHGATAGGKWTPEYSSWAAMNQRCNDPNSRHYSYYGGRGISVHPDWKGPGSFPRFLEHIGARPEPKSDYSLDRIDPEGNYEPGNVRWATRLEQTRNRR